MTPSEVLSYLEKLCHVVANTDQVIMVGGVQMVWTIRGHAESKQRHHERNREADRVVERRVYNDQEVRPPSVATDE